MATVTPKYLYEMTIKSGYKETVLYFNDQDTVNDAADFLFSGKNGDYIAFAAKVPENKVDALVYFAFRRYNVTGFCIRLVVNNGEPVGFIVKNAPKNWRIENESIVDDNSTDLVHDS